MKATGIVRKIDELGRIVIPKEIRKVLKIREGNSIEIYSGGNGEIILKKYEPMNELLEIAKQYVETLNNTTGFAACITDTDNIIAISGASKLVYLNKEINEKISSKIRDRIIWKSSENESISILKNENLNKYYEVIVSPIICDGDLIGSVILFSIDSNKRFTNVEYKVLQVVSDFLGKQMEI